VKIILDTHVLLWALQDDKRLSTRGRECILDTKNVVIVSSVSLWEIAIKQTLGKISVSLQAVIDAVRTSGFSELSLSFQHCAHLLSLPQKHRDPFDRMLIAQSLVEQAKLLTHDSTLAGYSDQVILL